MKNILLISIFVFLLASVRAATLLLGGVDDSASDGEVADNMKKLNKSRIESLPQSKGTDDGKLEKTLMNIEKLLAEPMQPRAQTQITPAQTTSMPTSRPSDDHNSKQSQKDKIAKSKEQAEVFRRLENASPQSFDEPILLADTLFLNGDLDAAAVFYKRGMKLEDKKSRAWALLQLGNCTTDSDVEIAKESYQALIDEFPDSEWVPMARVAYKLLVWKETNNVDTLLKSIEQDN